VRTELFGDLEPLAVSAQVLSRTELRAFARQRIAELRWPLEPVEGLCPVEAAHKDEAWLRGELEKRTHRLARRAGLEIEPLLEQRPALEGGGTAYCPRCLTQYVQAGALCAACPGVPLQRA